jgi:predicted small lipoprotein YifL
MIAAACKHIIFGLLTLAALGACGLKGPLYLPDSSQQEVAAPGEAEQETPKRRTTPRPAPQSQKEDVDRANESPPASASDPDRSADPPQL